MRDKIRNWTTVEAPKIAKLPSSVYLRSQSLPAYHMFPMHAHRWNQFVYATSGVLVVKAEDSWYVITPQQAIWLPTGLRHTSGALQDAELRNLYVADHPRLRMPKECTILSVSPFLRALIIELQDIGVRQEDSAYTNRLNSLISEQLRRQKKLDFYLAWPRSPKLRAICEAVYEAPADPRSVEDWGSELGASPRTLARHFESEVGMNLREWRRRLRLFRSIEWLGAGRSVTDVAFDLGYSSTSAFTYMFRQEMGCPPTRWRPR
jgi:AraC-like DNA-binding protein